MDVDNTFLAVGLVLAFSVVSGITSSLFLVSPKKMIRGKRFFCRKKVDLFNHYLKFETSYKKGLLNEKEWRNKKNDLLKKYKEMIK
tara:strand:- start:75 stop:332 length:258 start_codon:yes stop_codon:yes gene_type:complete